jgi:hypothetical protein
MATRGDFFLATRGDPSLATREDFFMATDNLIADRRRECAQLLAGRQGRSPYGWLSPA